MTGLVIVRNIKKIRGRSQSSPLASKIMVNIDAFLGNRCALKFEKRLHRQIIALDLQQGQNEEGMKHTRIN